VTVTCDRSGRIRFGSAVDPTNAGKGRGRPSLDRNTTVSLRIGSEARYYKRE
jgi:hypothetical protein